MLSVPVSSLTAISEHLFLQPSHASETTDTTPTMASYDFNTCFLKIQPAQNHNLSEVISAVNIGLL